MDTNAQNCSRETSTFLARSPASRPARRHALVIILAFLLIFCAIVPFARVSILPIGTFIPTFDAIVALSNLVTAGLLLVGFSRSRLRAVVWLAGGYLFTALMALAHLLAQPELFASADFHLTALKTVAWVEVFRKAGFPIFVIGYVLLNRRWETRGKSHLSSRARIVLACAGAIAGMYVLFFLATAAHPILPALAIYDGYTKTMVNINVLGLLFSLIALIILGLQHPYSVLDLWLLVVTCAWIPCIALSTIINAGPSDLGFAAGHLYGLAAASLLPAVLLFEARRLTGRLDEAIAVAAERNAQLAHSREELARAQRLEAIGQLTGGIAHDFNNLLTVVIGNLELIRCANSDAQKIDRLAKAALKAAQRGEHLVRQLLTYAGKQINRPQIVNLNQLVANVENLMHRVIGEQIEVVTMLSPVLAPAQIDPAQFEAAILNLAINSRDAMAGSGRILIETRNTNIDEDQVAHNPELAPGRYVMITVSDTGKGMTPAVLARAFEPFFTTKEVGRGSGLGLSQVYGFTKTAGGHVEIESEFGAGTIVKLYLPQSVARSASSEEEPETAPLRSAGRRGTILLVEDDAEVLAVTAESLREFGYQVVTAVDAMQALEILAADQPVDLLFSDVVMPGSINGAQLALRARYVRPKLKVMLTSGYTAAALSREHGLPDNLDIVSKPVGREELAAKLRPVIGT